MPKFLRAVGKAIAGAPKAIGKTVEQAIHNPLKAAPPILAIAAPAIAPALAASLGVSTTVAAAGVGATVGAGQAVASHTNVLKGATAGAIMGGSASAAANMSVVEAVVTQGSAAAVSSAIQGGDPLVAATLAAGATAMVRACEPEVKPEIKQEVVKPEPLPKEPAKVVPPKTTDIVDPTTTVTTQATQQPPERLFRQIDGSVCTKSEMLYATALSNASDPSMGIVGLPGAIAAPILQSKGLVRMECALEFVQGIVGEPDPPAPTGTERFLLKAAEVLTEMNRGIH